MRNILSETIEQYITHSNNKSPYILGSDFAIIDNPSFDILPNHPYKNPLVVAIYCQQGCGKGRINTNIYNIEANSFFIVLPGQITELIDISNDFKAIYILMTNAFTNSLGIGNTFSLNSIITASPYIKLETRAQQALDGYISMCRNLVDTPSNPNRHEILLLLTRAFFLGLGYFMHNCVKEDKRHQEELTTTFIHLVEQNYKQHRDLQFYADKMSLTAKHISKVIKASSGKSATEWIEKYVILDAMTQLSSTNRSIKEIAYSLHFPSQSFFGKYFNRIVGLSPVAYRNKHLK
ncbi:MAG: helix-turn-helix domain-containing protein [Alistipes sp.]|nr:helix-turn-helix domain-containing protein [Alistipes sp.]